MPCAHGSIDSIPQFLLPNEANDRVVVLTAHNGEALVIRALYNLVWKNNQPCARRYGTLDSLMRCSPTPDAYIIVISFFMTLATAHGLQLRPP